jgi:dihydropteroate synthase
MQNEPQTMQRAPSYALASLDITEYLESRIAACIAQGIAPERIVVDPGIGFGKRADHNLEIMERLSLLHALGRPILLGLSRKGIVGGRDNKLQPKERLPGSLAGALAGVAQGVQLLRVHDVAETRQAVGIWRAATARQQAGESSCDA